MALYQDGNVTGGLCKDVGGKALFIGQGEISCICSEDTYTAIGSDDATTCHILVLSFDRQLGNRSIQFAACSHADTDTEETSKRLVKQIIKHMEKKVQTLDPTFSIVAEDLEGSAFLLGGFLGDRSEAAMSKQINSGVKKALKERLPRFRIREEITLERNTLLKGNQVPIPKYYGALYNISSSAFEPFRFPLDTRGPASAYRKAILAFARSNFADPFVWVEVANGQVLIPAVTFSALGPQVFRMVTGIYNVVFHCPADRAIEILSTSPTAEPPHFIEDFKELLVFFDLWVKLEKEGVARPNPNIPYAFEARTGKPLPYPNSGVSPGDVAILEMVRSTLGAKDPVTLGTRRH